MSKSKIPHSKRQWKSIQKKKIQTQDATSDPQSAFKRFLPILLLHNQPSTLSVVPVYCCSLSLLLRLEKDLQAYLTSISLTDEPSSLLWIINDRPQQSFSSSITYHSFFDDALTVPWHPLIWMKKVSPSIAPLVG